MIPTQDIVDLIYDLRDPADHRHRAARVMLTALLRERGETVATSGRQVRTAAVALVERDDGRLLCVWNPRYGGWGFPGGRVEDGEATIDALHREVLEETGCGVLSAIVVFEGDHGIKLDDPTRASRIVLYRTLLDSISGPPREQAAGCPVTWLTRAEFLKWSPFRTLYAPIFANLARATGNFPQREGDSLSHNLADRTKD